MPGLSRPAAIRGGGVGVPPPTVGAVRWESLFADLEARLEAAERADLLADVPELTRAELGGVGLGDRMRAALGARVTLDLTGGARLTGSVLEVDVAWVLLADGPRRHLVPLAALAAVGGLGRSVAAPAGALGRRLGLGPVLRALARDRALVRVGHRAGQVRGRIDAVGADHLEVAAAGLDDDRPSGERVLVPFAALEVISSG